MFDFFPFHRELDQLGYEKLIEMAYEKSKVNSVLKLAHFQLVLLPGHCQLILSYLLITLFPSVTGKSASSHRWWKEF